MRKDNAPQNFAVLRLMALNLLKQELSSKLALWLNALSVAGMPLTCSRFSLDKMRLS